MLHPPSSSERLLLPCLLPALFAVLGSRAAQEPTEPDDKGGLPLETTREIRFTTDEGTWISLDVSPDGETIVFELVGDLFTLPFAGGRATRITGGPAYDAQPRYSPDGETLVFVSDRDGAENLWLADADGTNARALTKGGTSRYQSPEWTPDGWVVVSKGRGGAGRAYDQRAYDLFLYDPAGGSGVKLELAEGSPSYGMLMGAAAGRNPDFVYASMLPTATPGRDTLWSWQVVRIDRGGGETVRVTNALGAAVRPVISPDGRTLVYSTRDDAQQSLRVKDLETGDERWLWRGTQRDEQQSLFSRDLLPGSAFTPDGSAVVLYDEGGLWRVDVESGDRTEIPFEADVELDLGPLVRFDYTIDDDELVVRQIRGARPSPDGRRIAFSALQKVWVMDLPDGEPRRLTRSPLSEQVPAWSPDGRYVAYVTWTEEGGDIYRTRSDGRGEPERLTRASAAYDGLNYTPDGTRLVATRRPRQASVMERAAPLDLVWIPSTGGDTTVIGPFDGRAPTSGNNLPHFTRDGERIYFHAGGEGLVSVRWDGTDRQSHLLSDAETLRLSPNGDRAIGLWNGWVYLLTVPRAGAPANVPVSKGSGSVPIERATDVAGDFIGWGADGGSFHYSLGRSYFIYDLEAGEAAKAASAPDEEEEGEDEGEPQGYEPSRVDVVVRAARDRPEGSVVLRGARILTMRGDEIIEDGDLVVTRNRIAAVGRRGRVPIPDGARVIDVSGTTILPGWIDMHAHPRVPAGVHRTQVWSYLSNLAYGVTTTRDPQTGTTDVLAYQDLVATGGILGPRVFSTGPGIFSSLDIKSLEDARNVMRRYAEFYDTRYIKQYGAGERKVRQWLVMAARELSITPVTEPYYDVKKNVTEALDGYRDQAHSFPIYPVHKDLIEVFAQGGTAITATLITTFGGPKAYDYYFTRRELHDDPKVRRFYPHEIVDRLTRRSTRWFAEDQYVWRQHAVEIKKMMDAGVEIALGGHGNFQGLGVHWELEMHADGSGIPLYDLMKVGTINGARVLGLEAELGSLEPGKLADLQVLEANPLDDIRNIGAIRLVMKNGRLYEAATLNEVWPRQRELPRQWWWED